MAMASACAFPEPQLVPDEAGVSSDAASPDGAMPTDASVVDSVFAIDGNQDVDPDGAAQEASTRPDGAALKDAAGCVDQCDCDEDGVRSNNPSCSPVGKDCNDLDPFIPHDGFVASKPAKGATGDWDCDGKVTKQFPVNVSCGLLANCNAAGFTGDPGCGESGAFVTCKPSLLPLVTCDVKSTETVTQGCR
jgi:hypothetical protein